MKLLPTCRLCNFTSFHCLTAFSFPFTKNGKFDKLVEFVSSFPRWELERVSATDILFLPPFPSLGKHAPRARSDREGRSPEMGRRKKRKSQEGASLTTLLPSPHISPDRTSLFALNPPLFLGSQFRERKTYFCCTV